MSGYKKATASHIIKEPKNNIRIKGSENPLKLAVARVCSEWLAAPERSWNFKGSVDENSARLIHYLKSRFMDYTWINTSSQSPFEVVCVDAKVAVEVKSVKKGNKTIIANATLYPDKVKASDVLTTKQLADYKGTEDTWLDVLVVCVDREANYVYDYAIVDGAWFGVTYEDYLSCKEFFTTLNSDNFMGPLLDVYNDCYEEDHGEASPFVTKLINKQFGKDFKFNLRKLIQLPNPVYFGLDTSGYWGI